MEFANVGVYIRLSYHTFWQYADKGPNPGDQDSFNGDSAGLQRYVIETVTASTNSESGCYSMARGS